MKRKSAVAGSFYPADREELTTMVDSFLASAKDLKLKKLRGIIAPHAGYIYSGPTAGVAYRQLSELPEKNYTVFILAPSHYAYIAASVGKFSAYETPLGEVPVSEKICAELDLPFVPEAHEREHSLEVQLPFLQRSLRNFSIVPILCGDIDPAILAEKLKPYFGQPGNLFVFSSDLSHFFPLPVAEKKDAETLKNIVAKNLNGEIDACGHVPIEVALRLAERIELLAHSTSAETSGDESSVVGYAALAVF